MKRYKIVKAAICFLQIMLIEGCQKFIMVDPPITQLTSGSVFESDQTALAAMNGIYSTLQGPDGFANGGTQSMGFLTGLSSDELTNYYAYPDQIKFYQNALSKNNNTLYNAFWAVPYNSIYDANSLLQGIRGSTKISSSVNRELTGEAKFIRAFCNFYLTNLFGDIPMVSITDYKINATAFRVARDSVYRQIIADLTDAQTLMAQDYTFSNGERVRPNSWAAAAMLARVYLYAGRWEDAEIQATAVINKSDLYSLDADLNQVFLKNSNETIWQLMPNAPGQNTNEGSIYILTSEPAYATLSSRLVNAFEPGDLRRQNWVADTIIGLDTFYYPFKYKVKTSEILTEYSMVLRLAEQYLIRAEARTDLDNLNGALQDLNVIRERAGLPSLADIDKATIQSDILHERQVELFTEWGHRWLDLIRTRQANPILGSIKGDWQQTDTLFPIPQGEIQKDANLTQNPGY
jgi:hypothetical protein